MSEMIFATLIVLETIDGRLLMIKRKNPPNKDLYSPIGGKIHLQGAESPYQCARREIFEETGIDSDKTKIKLKSIVTEESYNNKDHWMMFIFTGLFPSDSPPPECGEGEFFLVSPEDFTLLSIPDSDKRILWPLILDKNIVFFSVRIIMDGEFVKDYEIEEIKKEKIITL